MRAKVLREKRLKLINQERALYAKEDAENYKWSAEDEAEAKRIQGELADVETQLERAERDENLSKRLSDLSNGDERRERRRDRRIGREDFNQRNDPDEDDDDESPRFRDRALALQAWFRAGSDEGIETEQRDACRRLGFNPMRRQINIGIGDEGFITELGNVYRENNADHAKRLSTRMCRDRADSAREDFEAMQRDAEPRRRRSKRDRRAAMSAFNGSTGGYAVPPEFLNLFDVNMLDFSGVMQVAEIIRTSTGGEMPWITMDDTSNEGEFIGESASIDGSTSPDLAAQMWYAYKCHAKMLKVPQELIEDNAFNLVGRIGAMLGERLGRIKERKLTLGSGVKCPRGFTLDATLGVSAASATSINPDELIDLQASIDPAYERNARWMLHRLIVAHLRKKKDGTGQYIWQPGMTSGAPDLLLGRGVTYNSYLQSTVATGTKTVFFGDFSKIKVREVAKLRLIRLDERYAEYDQVAFDALQRIDGKLLKTVTPSVKFLQQA